MESLVPSHHMLIQNQAVIPNHHLTCSCALWDWRALIWVCKAVPCDCRPAACFSSFWHCSDIVLSIACKLLLSARRVAFWWQDTKHGNLRRQTRSHESKTSKQHHEDLDNDLNHELLPFSPDNTTDRGHWLSKAVDLQYRFLVQTIWNLCKNYLCAKGKIN